MADAQFSALTSVFSVGGLIGSAGANVVMDSRGRRGALRVSAVLTTLGGFLMAVASGYIPLVVGRYVLPALQNIVQSNQLPQIVDRHRFRRWHMPHPNLHRRDIASEDSRQSRSVHFIRPQPPVPLHIYLITGVFTQFSIVVGIMITQLIGFKLATPTAWRYVLFLSGLTAVGQFLISPTMVESPVWAIRNGDPQSGKVYHQKLWKDGDSHCKQPTSFKLAWPNHYLVAPDEDPLLAKDPDDVREHAVSIPHALQARELRLPLIIVSLAMVSQQISGAILSTSVQGHVAELPLAWCRCERRCA